MVISWLDYFILSQRSWWHASLTFVYRIRSERGTSSIRWSSSHPQIPRSSSSLSKWLPSSVSHSFVNLFFKLQVSFKFLESRHKRDSNLFLRGHKVNRRITATFLWYLVINIWWAHTHTFSLSLSSSLTHTNSHKHKHTHGVSLPRHMHTFSLSSTHFLMFLSLTHIYDISISLYIYLSRKHRKMMSLPHTRACTHPHAHTHARWQGYFCHCLRA